MIPDGGCWIEPEDRTPGQTWTLTRRSVDSKPGYDLGLSDESVRMEWSGDAWIRRDTIYPAQFQPPVHAALLVCLHSNNGWRIEPPPSPVTPEQAIADRFELIGILRKIAVNHKGRIVPKWIEGTDLQMRAPGIEKWVKE